MSIKMVRRFFISITPIDLPEIPKFEPDNFDDWTLNAFITFNSISSGFHRLVHSDIRIADSISPERLYFGVLKKNVPAEFQKFLGPIFLGQFHWFFMCQPDGQPGRLLTTGWWNNSKIREAPLLVATGRFKDPERKKKGRFTIDETPNRRGWIFDAIPAEELNAAQQGRCVIFSEVPTT